MRESEDKRSKFREEIRRRHIGHKLRENRERMLQQQNYMFGPLDPNLADTFIGLIRWSLPRLIEFKRNADYGAIFNDLGVFDLPSQEHPETLSYCLNSQLLAHGQYLVDAVKKDVPVHVLGELEDEEYHPSEEQDEPIGQAEVDVVMRLLKLADRLHLQKFSMQSMVLILKMLWNVYVNNYHQPSTHYPPEEGMEILRLWLRCINKLLHSAHSALMRTHLEELGLVTTINSLIDIAPKFHLDIHQQLLTLIDQYTAFEDKPIDQLAGLVVTSTRDEEIKARYVVYCMFLIKENMEPLLMGALSVLDQCFSRHSYLIDYVDGKLYGHILRLMRHPQRQISVAALDVINTVAYFSDGICDEMMELPTSILDETYNRLVYESRQPRQQPYTQRSIDKCTNILCDLLLTRNRQVKARLYGHPVWEMIYQNIEESSPLFSVVIVFQYFFACFGRTKSLKVLPSILDAFANLPLSNETSPHIREVRKIMQNLMNEATEFWTEEDYDSLVGMLEQRGLLRYIEMDLEAHS